MKTIILNGNPATGRPDFNGFLDRLLDTLHRQSQEARIFNLAEMKLHYCTGCWTCWWRTPGKCVFRDDMDLVLTEIAGADRLVFASPLDMGFIHSSIKRVMDRMIPLLLPYVDLYQGECHHYLRYEKSPWFGVLIEKERDTDPEDLEIINTCFQRLSLNYRTRLLFTKTNEVSVEEVAHEINRI